MGAVGLLVFFARAFVRAPSLWLCAAPLLVSCVVLLVFQL
jgi:hypothetical protein